MKVSKQVEWTQISGQCRDLQGKVPSGALNLLSNSTTMECQAACSSFEFNYVLNSTADSNSSIQACQHSSAGDCLAFTGVVGSGSEIDGFTCFLPKSKPSISPNWLSGQGACTVDGELMPGLTKLFVTGTQIKGWTKASFRQHCLTLCKSYLDAKACQLDMAGTNDWNCSYYKVSPSEASGHSNYECWF